MKNYLFRAGVVALGAGALLLASIPAAQATNGLKVGGKDRYATSAIIAEDAYPSGSDKIYLARGDVFADALSAGSLDDGGFMIMNANGDVSQTREAIKRMGAKQVVALGGPKAISDGAMKQVASGIKVTRIYGPNRYDTSAKTALEAWKGRQPHVVYLANGLGSDGQGSPDALAGGMLTDGPIVLINPRDPNNDVAKNVIAKFNPNKVVALGGTGAVSDAILSTLGKGY